MFDAHYHLPATHEGILCTSKRSEWASLDSITSPAIISSLGWLPPEEKPDIRELEALLSLHPCWQIGEVGLDRRYPDTDEQKEFLLACLDLARTHHRFVTLHCVHHDGLMLSLLDKSVPTLWHGFTGSPESARAFARKGGVLSFGPRLMKTKLWSRLEDIADLPYLLETDEPGDQGNISLWRKEFARRLHLSNEELEAHLAKSFRLLAW